ncbi:MAG TPA: hypothetical protein VJQ82_02620 [Terriglobales bacterium]|nr:hypothetical protein [Terriglobales bacterium]
MKIEVFSLFLAAAALAQPGPNSPVFPGNPPGGIGASCPQTPIGYLTAAGQYVSCVAGLWTVSGAGMGVTSFNTRTGAVTLTSADVTTALGYTPLSGPASSTNGNLPSFNGTGGNVLQDSGILASNVALLNGSAFTGQVTSSFNSAASTPVVKLTGTLFTGGTGTTTMPFVYIDPAGTSSTVWSTAGTLLGLNAPSGCTGNVIDAQTNGLTAFKVACGGGITTTALNVTSATSTLNQIQITNSNAYIWAGRSTILSPSDGVVNLQNNAEDGFTRLDLGGTTSSFGAIGVTNQTNPIILILDASGGATADLEIGNQKSATGQRFVCIDTNGKLVSSASACVGT